MRAERRRKLAAQASARNIRAARERRFAEEDGFAREGVPTLRPTRIAGGQSNFVGAVGEPTYQRPIKGMPDDVEVGCTVIAIDWRAKSRERASVRGGSELAMRRETDTRPERRLPSAGPGPAVSKRTKGAAR